MNFFKYWELSDAERRKLLTRTQVDADKYYDVVRPIIEDVKANGDAAVVKYTKQFDGASILPNCLKVTPEEIQV